jgi:NNP family nitrate/nitrite transporter-like MFS transporter
MLVMLRTVQIRWTRTWAEKGGRPRAQPPVELPDYGAATPGRPSTTRA